MLRRALVACGRVVRLGAAIQEPTRKKLIERLQKICLECENAYSIVLARLKPVRDSFQDPKQLANELRDFAADKETRDAFKPEKLCADVDNLLMELASNLDPLKYSVDRTRLTEMKNGLSQVGNFDAALYASYDQFTKQLGRLADDITRPGGDVQERSEYARLVVQDFEEDLRLQVDEVRKLKNLILHGP